MGFDGRATGFREGMQETALKISGIEGLMAKKKTAVRGGLRTAPASNFLQERFYNFIAWIVNQRIKQLGEKRINRVHIQYQRFFDYVF
jgi:uncharacterized protein YifN (PemK superfamily)